jgi:replicative DNA helicase
MYDHREAIDIITLQQRLADRQQLEPVGGIPYLNGLQDGVPSAANLSYYLEIIQEKYLLRKMIHTCTDVIGRVYDFDGDVEALSTESKRNAADERIARAGWKAHQATRHRCHSKVENFSIAGANWRRGHGVHRHG